MQNTCAKRTSPGAKFVWLLHRMLTASSSVISECASAWTGGRPFRSKGAGNALCLPSPEFDVRVSPVDAGQSILVGISPTRGERKGTPEAESGAGAARTSRELAYVTTRRPHVCRAHHLPLHIARLVRTEKRPPLPSMQHQTMIGAGPMQFVFPDALAPREKKEKQTRS